MQFKVYCDGGSRGNPGHSAAGVVIYKDDKLVKAFGKYLGIGTNNVAEYHAAFMGLLSIREFDPKGQGNVLMLLDSLLVVNQMKGIFKCRDSKMQELKIQCEDACNFFSNSVSWLHIPRAKNCLADLEVNKALDAFLRKEI